jgi:hypothetical protein
MPFQSEEQRRYLWANEPEIARDWTDTYGSRIEAALGGIMRLGYLHGGVTHPDGRRGFPGGSGRPGDSPMGTSSTGGLSSGANYGYSGVHDTGAVSQTPGRTTSKSTKGFFDNLLSGIWGLRKFSPTYQAIQLGKKAFTPQTPAQKLQANINKGYDVNNPAEMHGAETRTGPVSGPDRGNNPYITPQYMDDVYAQNVMEEDGIDIDTSTGNMEDWSQRFRVGNPYRQDKQGQLDPQIVEMISKLYT